VRSIGCGAAHLAWILRLTKEFAFRRSMRRLARFDYGPALTPKEAVMWFAAIAAALPLIPLPTPRMDVALHLEDAVTTDEPAPPPIAAPPAEEERVKLKLVTTEIVNVAETFLDLPIGTERFVTLGDHRYVFVLEWHYHPPGYPGAPTGWHHGVTVYELR
jgi:hypothetical protein